MVQVACDELEICPSESILETLDGIMVLYAKASLEMGWAEFIQSSASVHIMYLSVHHCNSLNNSE